MICFLRTARRIQEVLYPYRRAAHRLSFSTNAPNSNKAKPHSPPSAEHPQRRSVSEPISHINILNHQISPPKTIILSEEAQKAVWASKMISLICNSSPPTSIENSLKKQI